MLGWEMSRRSLKGFLEIRVFLLLRITKSVTPMRSLLSLFSLLAIGAATLSAQVVQINFGTSASLTGWNDISGFPSVGQQFALNDSDGLSTSAVFTLDSRFNSTNTTGAPGAVGDFPAAVTTASLFGNVGVFPSGGSSYPSPGWTISGLDSNLTYGVEIFASRMNVSDVRTTDYTLTGSAVTVGTLDAANNETNILSMSNISPDGSGNIAFSMTPSVSNTNSTGFIYISGLRLIANSPSAVPEPQTYALILGGFGLGLVFLRRRLRSRK